MITAKENIICWVKHGFNGCETFEDVCKMCHPAISSFQDYMKHIRKIPPIPSFFKVNYQQDVKVFMVSLIMSLECFETYVNSITAYDTNMDTPDHEYTMLQNNNYATSVAEAYGDKEISYGNAINVNYVTNPPILDKELNERMYRNAFNFSATVDLTGNVNDCIDDTEKQEVRPNTPKNRLNILEEAESNSQLKEDKMKKELAWEERFYEMYEDKFHSMSNSTLISKEKYVYIVECLKSIVKKGPKQRSLPEDEKRLNKKYKLLTNFKYKCLYRKAKNDQWLQTTL
jgi:hypothetical protein